MIKDFSDFKVSSIILSISVDRSYLVAFGYIYSVDKTLQRVLGFIYKSVYNRLVLYIRLVMMFYLPS